MSRHRRLTILAVMAAVGLLLAGCGAGRSTTSQASTGHGAGSATTTGQGATTAGQGATATGTGTGQGATTPTQPYGPGVRTTPSDAAAVAVIQNWTTALAAGHIKVAAGYFALPSVFANGFNSKGLIAVATVRSKYDAVVVNESLSCGATLISASQHGKYIAAVFRLINRKGPGADCGSGTGQKAATDFVIRDGHIVDWIRAPVPTGNGAPPVPSNAATQSQSD